MRLNIDFQEMPVTNRMKQGKLSKKMPIPYSIYDRWTLANFGGQKICVKTPLV